MAFEPVAIDDTCVLALELQDNFGTTYADNTPYGNHATRTGAVQTNGPCGLALTFDGTDDYLSVADAASLDCAALTVEAWVKLDATWAAVGYILAKCEDDGSEYSYGFGCDATLKPFLLISNDGAAGTAETANTAISAAVWHHLVGTYAETNGVLAGTYLLYVDGAVVASNATGAEPTLHVGTGRVTVGARWDSTVVAEAVEEFKGKIGGVRVWNRALSAQEIHELHAVHAGDNTEE